MPTILNTGSAFDAKMDEILRELGLEEKEIRIYKYLARKRQLTAYQIAKGIGLNRSTVYDNVDRLVRKGFVSSLILHGKKLYQVNTVDKILSSLKEKETLVHALLPEIKKLKGEQEVSVELLEGTEGQREHFFSVFNLGRQRIVKSLHVIGGGDVSTFGSRLYIHKLIAEWKKLKRSGNYKCIWDESFRGKAIVKQFNPGGEDRFLPSLPSEVTTLIFGDYVVIGFTMDKPYVIRIQHKLVAKTFESYFKLMWESAKQ